MRETVLREGAHDSDSETYLILAGQDAPFTSWAPHFDYSKDGCLTPNTIAKHSNSVVL